MLDLLKERQTSIEITDARGKGFMIEVEFAMDAVAELTVSRMLPCGLCASVHAQQTSRYPVAAAAHHQAGRRATVPRNPRL